VSIALVAIVLAFWLILQSPPPPPDERPATAMSLRKFAHQAVLRAKFGSQVKTIRGKFEKPARILVEEWNQSISTNNCEKVRTFGYSSDPNCVYQEALRQEISSAGLCPQSARPADCAKQPFKSDWVVGKFPRPFGTRAPRLPSKPC